ncbi:MAG: hypothetical protein GAK28_01426 [Luteibacter sp.]|uniref:hypothetical protein n=1 Tax=Luteibacter sp. TaxID=1886636 RepID=UPI001384841F|nr:hypothetical protein [Luteibacter sp.]KAF1007950.1 MAG: hypothetical protein GAK28_01426 [Luteibacter sp.]
MNARPYILGCLCLVGATGTAAASDIDLSTLLSLGGVVSSSSSFEGSAPSAPQAPGRDPSGAMDAAPTHRASTNTASRPVAPVPSPTSTDIENGPHDGPSPVRSSSPSWQSLLPGSML